MPSQHAAEEAHARTPARASTALALLYLAVALVGLVALTPAPCQTLARPGWAGSGMTVERWWPHAVFCAFGPDSLATLDPAASTLHRASAHLDDLQTLGVDALLLRDLAPRPAISPGGPALSDRFGTIEELDNLIGDAVRHSMRVVVELPQGLTGADLTNAARFWLNRGATGLALPNSDPAGIRAVRAVLHGYVGERVLIAEDIAEGKGGGTLSPEPAAAAIARPDSQPHRGSRGSMGAIASERTGPHADQPDLVRIALPAITGGAGPIRQAIERARARTLAHGAVPMLSTKGSAVGPSALVSATALLGSGGAVLLEADSLDLPKVAGSETQTGVFAWYRQWSGLHRGSATMRSGDDTLLDHDGEGALVWIRQARSGAAPVVAICNVTDKPIHLSLVSDIARLRLRGSFLRTIARTDGGMGAMPLRDVVLPAFGVYVGTLSR